MSVVICEGCGVRNLPNTAIIELTNGTFPLCPQCRTELRAALAARPAPAADDDDAGLGPTGKPRCPKCGNSFQNGTPADAPGFQRCATCKHVWQPYPSAPAADDAGRAVTGWRPIETCPKGEQVLFWFPDSLSGKMPLPAMCRVGTLSDFTHRKPTHWQPLPAPPAAGDAK